MRDSGFTGHDQAEGKPEQLDPTEPMYEHWRDESRAIRTDPYEAVHIAQPDSGQTSEEDFEEQLPMLPWQKNLMVPLIEYRTTANLLYYAAGTDLDEVAERRYWEAWKQLRVAISAELAAAEAKGARDLAEKLLDELPAAVFIPDEATDEAYALGVGLAEYRLKVAQMLIAELQRTNSIKEAE